MEWSLVTQKKSVQKYSLPVASREAAASPAPADDTLCDDCFGQHVSADGAGVVFSALGAVRQAGHAIQAYKVACRNTIHCWKD